MDDHVVKLADYDGFGGKVQRAELDYLTGHKRR